MKRQLKEALADANFIIEAINNHYELLGALKHALGVIESLTEYEKQALEVRLCEDIDFQRMTQAIAKAEGK